MRRPISRPSERSSTRPRNEPPETAGSRVGAHAQHRAVTADAHREHVDQEAIERCALAVARQPSAATAHDHGVGAEPAARRPALRQHVVAGAAEDPVGVRAVRGQLVVSAASVKLVADADRARALQAVRPVVADEDVRPRAAADVLDAGELVALARLAVGSRVAEIDADRRRPPVVGDLVAPLAAVDDVGGRRLTRGRGGAGGVAVEEVVPGAGADHVGVGPTEEELAGRAAEQLHRCQARRPARCRDHRCPTPASGRSGRRRCGRCRRRR